MSVDVEIVRLLTAAKNARSALAFTYTNIDGDRPHWCPFANGYHEATCRGMLKIQDELRAAIEAAETPR